MTSRIINDISEYIFISDIPKKADAIFLLGGSHPAQPEYAADLYHKGYAKLIIPSGGVSIKRDKWPGVQFKSDIYKKDYKTDCEFFTDVLQKNNVPISAIAGEDKSRHTRDNAFFSKALIDEKSLEIKTAIIICKAFHARRCLMLYQMAFPNVNFLVCPVHCYNIKKDNWYKSDVGIDRVLGELTRCGNQFTNDIKNYLKKQ